MSILESFQQKVTEGLIEYDPMQEQSVQLLSEIQQFLEEDALDTSNKPRKKSFFSRLFDSSPSTDIPIHKGVYLWGGVGRGKTWLMDKFYKSVNIKNKRRYHFNRFMLDLHTALKQHPEQKNPLEAVAQELAKDMRLLCLDEVHLTEVANAALLYPLLVQLMKLGVIIVSTSNRHPDELYRGSIQAKRFIEPTEFIKSHMHVINLDNGIDYRRLRTERILGESPAIFARKQADLEQCFTKLGQGVVLKEHTLSIHNRDVKVLRSCDNVVWFDFVELCDTTRTTSDYIWLSEQYEVLMISNVPVMDAERDQAARRFFYLVDELYDRKTRFIFSADAALDQLYKGHRLRFGFKRTLSRLLAMHTANRLTC